MIFDKPDRESALNSASRSRAGPWRTLEFARRRRRVRSAPGLGFARRETVGVAWPSAARGRTFANKTRTLGFGRREESGSLGAMARVAGAITTGARRLRPDRPVARSRAIA